MIILVTGGSGCGKSFYAESLCMKLPKPRYYIAAMRPFGEESERKIARHREMRKDKGFETIEKHTDLASLRLPCPGTALLECICNLTANEMFDENGAYEDPYNRVVKGVEALSLQCSNLIVVTNDIGSDGHLYDAGTNAYIIALGKINAELAKRADAVYELVCGIPIVRKGALME